MNSKLIAWLLAIVVGLIALLAVFEQGDRSGSGPVGEYFLDGFGTDANAVNRIDLQFGGDESGISIRRDGDAWVVVERDGYPADFKMLAGLVSSLANARIVEQKTSNPDNYEKLGVGDPESGGSGTAITLNGDDFAYNVIIGNQAQRSYRYARLADDATSYLVDQAFDIANAPDEWLDTEIVDIAADRVRHVAINHANGETITIEKASRDDKNYSVFGIPEGRDLTYESVGNGIAGVLAGLSLEKVRKAQDGDVSTITTFETWDGLRVVVSVISEEDSTWLSFAAEEGSIDSDEEQVAATSEVDAINARLDGWQYQVTDYKLNPVVRRWEDILKDTDDAD